MTSVIFQDEVDVVERIPRNCGRFLTIQVLLTPLTKDDEGILPYVMQANHDMDKTTKQFGQQNRWRATAHAADPGSLERRKQSLVFGIVFLVFGK